MRRITAGALVAWLGLLPALAARAADPPAKVEVPYRLTDTKHLMVRAKLNGKGPFNLIVDTGAPAVFVTKAVADRAKLKPGEKGWVELDTFELEGGLKVPGAKARVEDLVQLDGMNTMGLAGVELHGVIGYTVLAKYRVEYDLTSDRLVFEHLPQFEPPPLVPLGGKGNEGIQSMGPMVKMMAAFLGLKPNFATVPRGFTGIRVEEAGGKVRVAAVLPGSPAATAGFKVGDLITGVKTDDIATGKDLHKALAKAGVGTKWRFTVSRGGKDEEVVVELGKGL